MARKLKETRVRVWTTVDPDTYLKMQIVESRTFVPIHRQIRDILKEHYADVRSYPPA